MQKGPHSSTTRKIVRSFSSAPRAIFSEMAVPRVSFAFLLLLAGSSVAGNSSKSSEEDADSSGSDFVPHFHPFQFPPQSIFSPQELTSLQQTHVLGAFNHRFQTPPRLGSSQFGSAALGQPAILQSQSNQLQQVLIPPQPTQPQLLHPLPSPNPSRHPPQLGQQSGIIAPHQPVLLQQQPQHPQPIDSFRNQALQNQAGRSIPQSVRFPQQNLISQQQNIQRLPQQPQFAGPSAPHRVNQFNQQQQNRFGSSVQFPQPRPIINQQPFASPAPVINQQPFASPTPAINQQPLANPLPIVGHQQNFRQHTNFPQSTFNGDTRQENVLRNQISSANSARPTVFGPTSFPRANDEVASHFRVNVVHNKQPEQTSFFQKQAPQAVDSLPRSNFESQRTFNPSTPRQLSNRFPQEQNLRIQSAAIGHPVGLTETSNILLQKSQEQQQYTLQGDFFNNKDKGVTAIPKSTTTTQNYVTSTKKPDRTTVAHTTIKEITVNLKDSRAPVRSDASHQPTEGSRQKENQDVKQEGEKKEKGQRKSKKEKSQEDLINEQIQKLLQSHNLEIIDKDSESGSESQESKLAQFTQNLKGKYNYNVQLLNGGSILNDATSKKPARATTIIPPLPDLPEHIKKEYEIKLVSRDDLFKQFKIGGDGAIAEIAGNHNLGNNSIFLANGQRLEIFNIDGNGTTKKVPSSGARPTTRKPTTTAKPPRVLFEELTKKVIPPGADFELIRQKANGEIEKVNGVSGSDKVTFVFLEEQPDGSVKVQGVKGNTNNDLSEKESVNSLIKQIKDGSLKLPPSSQRTKSTSILTNEIPRSVSPTIKSYVTLPAPSTSGRTGFPVYYSSTAFPVAAETDYRHDGTYTPEPFSVTTAEVTTHSPRVTNFLKTSSRRSKTKSRVTFLPTLPVVESTIPTTFSSQRVRPTSSSTYLLRTTPTPRKTSKRIYNKLSSKYEDPSYATTDASTYGTGEYAYTEASTTPIDVVAEESNIEASLPLIDVLKENGLNEMAKFLDQSGLDTILNETGPYTIFIPTDRAFRALEAQLGGTDKAEDKFRENPRLLSGLLLHHVVPGSFRVEDLQDEMTGVSLAGTQLRVNTYAEKRSGHQRIVTINGARISGDLKDIAVPQGLAHAIDRVLFPLPVGDILQTLRGDRERKFNKFVKSLEAAGLADMLTGSKTYTVFAPTDNAFSALTDSELDKLLTRREAARTIVLRHIVPGTLYSAGMQYYLVKDSMEKGQKIEIQREQGKITANSAQVIAANIPATNGVIHAVETLL